MTTAILSAACLALLLLTIALSFLVIWMRYRQKYSKARFALFSASCIVSVVLLTLSTMTAVDWGHLTREAFGAILYGDPKYFARTPSLAEKITEKAIIALFGAVSIYFIASFCSRALNSWEGPRSLTEEELAKRFQGNDIASLAYAELRRLLAGQNDPLVDNRISVWTQSVAQAPEAVEFHKLTRIAFLEHFPEAEIDEGAWRQRIEAWVGEIAGHTMGESTPLILAPLPSWATDGEICERLALLNPTKDCLVYFIVDDRLARPPHSSTINGTQIECWGYRYLIRQGLPLKNYAKNLIKQFEQVTVGGTNALLSDTFVPARVERHGRSRLLSEVLGAWLRAPGRKQLAITGEYGQGKSTAMLEHCVQWARAYLKGERTEERIPLLIELRGKSPGETSPAEFLAQWGSRYGFRASQLSSLIQAGEALVIFEGFDELRNAGQPFDRHEHFNALWRFAYPGTKIIFTGRPNFFLDQSAKNSTLRVDSNLGAASNAFTELYEISMFEEREVIQACRSYPEDVRVGIAESFRNHEQFKEIVARPSMLPVVATIWPEVKADQMRGENITGVLLLEKYLRAIYSRKEAELENTRVGYEVPQLGNYLLLPRAVREALTLSIVWRMATGDLRNTISRIEFDRVIKASFENLLRSLQSTKVRTPTVNSSKALYERFLNENKSDFLEKVCTDVASAGIFVPDPAGGPSNLRFAHKQYFEYLIAKFAWARIAMAGDDVIDAISNSATTFTPITLLVTESFKHFDAIMGKNLSCFAKHENFIKINIGFMDLASYIIITHLTILRKLRRTDPADKINQSRSSNAHIESELTNDRATSVVKVNQRKKSILDNQFFVYMVASTGIISILSFISAILVAYPVKFVIVVTSLLFVFGAYYLSSRKVKSMDAALFYLFLSNKRASEEYPSGGERFFRRLSYSDRITSLKAQIAMRHRMLPLIRHPQSSISIKELVTDVEVPHR